MFSDVNGSLPTWSRCPLCSLRCVIGFGTTKSGGLVPLFPDGIQHGLCVRGLILADSISRHRPGTAYSGPNLEEIIPLSTALQSAGETMKKAMGIDLVIDGNQRAEVLEEAAIYASHSERIKAYLTAPGEDVLLLLNAWASGAEIGTLNNLDPSKPLLLIGDPFTTHPRSARPILDYRDKGGTLIVLDSASGKARGFGARNIIVNPFLQTEALAALLRAGEGSSGAMEKIDPTGELALAAQEIDAHDLTAVVVASSPGRGENWPALGYLGGQLAIQRKGSLVPLTAYGNAAIGARYIARGSLLPVGDLFEKSMTDRVVVAVGDGALSGISEAMAYHIRDALEVIQVSLNPHPDRATMHLPGVLQVEEAGHELSNMGVWESIPAAVAPPSGIPSTVTILRDLFMEEQVFDSSADSGAFPDQPRLESPEIGNSNPSHSVDEGLFTGIMIGDAGQFRFGIHTSDASYHPSTANIPVAVLSPREGKDLMARFGVDCMLVSEHDSCEVKIALDPHQIEGYISISAVNHHVAALFSWKMIDGLPMAIPTRIRVKSLKERP